MKYLNVYIKPNNGLVTGKNVYNSKEEALGAKNPPLGTRFYEVAEIRAGEVTGEYHCVGAYEGVIELLKTPHKNDYVYLDDNTFRVDRVTISSTHIVLVLSYCESYC